MSVPADPAFARVVRLCAATLAAGLEMSLDDVEDVRMVAEEGFVYACATRPACVEVSFTLTGGSVAMDVALGGSDPDDESVDLVEVLLGAVCDEFCVSADGATLHLLKRAGGADAS